MDCQQYRQSWSVQVEWDGRAAVDDAESLSIDVVGGNGLVSTTGCEDFDKGVDGEWCVVSVLRTHYPIAT